MPTYEFFCPEHGRIERMFMPYPPPPRVGCPHCGVASRRVASCPQMRLERAKLDTKEILEDTPWADQDGILETKYTSDKPFFDMASVRK